MTVTLITTLSIKQLFTSPVHFLAFGFGSGLAPKAPGTFGTLAAVPLYFLCAELGLVEYLLLVGAMSVLGVYLCGESARRLGCHDHPGIVWDEFCGFLLTMAGFTFSWQNLLAGFVLFRWFDIVKPWPIKVIDQKVSGGLGIMLDDLLAGGFAWLCLWSLNQANIY